MTPAFTRCGSLWRATCTLTGCEWSTRAQYPTEPAARLAWRRHWHTTHARSDQ